MSKQWPYFFLVFLLPLVFVLWWWGLFSTPVIEMVDRPSISYVYLNSSGDYSKVEDKHYEVLNLLKSQGIQGGQQITLIEQDPRVTSVSQRQAQAGVIVAANTIAPSPLLKGSLPLRRVLVVSARGHPFFVYGKAYGGLLEYLENHHLKMNMPILETTRNNTLTIEMAI